MLKSTLIAGGLVLLMLNTAQGAVELGQSANLDLEPAINGDVSATGLFPAQAMEDAFGAYLKWTKHRGISRLAAFESRADELEPAINGGVSATGLFPTQMMEEQFGAYLDWTEEREVRRFDAFRVTDFD
ncbi:MAG: hypothetical protein U9Q81_26035 [Pseudomonadota bacterium]|nr:hypothetical protein [Pseudomonadota bacterium]